MATMFVINFILNVWLGSEYSLDFSKQLQNTKKRVLLMNQLNNFFIKLFKSNFKVISNDSRNIITFQKFEKQSYLVQISKYFIHNIIW